MKDETAGVTIEEFVGLKPKMYLYLVDGNSGHKKAKDVNKNFVATISHNEYKDVLLKKKCLRHSMNSIQSKDHRIELMKSTKFLCLTLMIKYISKTINVIDQLWLLELIIKIQLP